MELIDSLQQLADQNYSGVAFLTAYGVTWLVCAGVWRSARERTAAYVTLFQGGVAFPLALGLSVLIGALGADRPVDPAITQLSILIGTSQLLGLPFLIYLIVSRRHTLLPFAFAAITSMHFVLYSWLYQTPLYIVMAVLISLGTMMVMTATPEQRSRVAAMRVCLLTGGLLLVTAATFLALRAFAE
ncbi:MAG: DUF7010 family protein [Leucobacter sp.]